MTDAPASSPHVEQTGEGGRVVAASSASLAAPRVTSDPAPRTLGLTPPHAAALAWAAGWFSALVILWLDPADRFVRQHALQSAIGLGALMALAIGSWGLGLLMAFVTPILFRGLTWLSTLAWIALGVVWLIGLVQAWRGRLVRLPFVSGWADRFTFPRSTPQAPSPLL